MVFSSIPFLFFFFPIFLLCYYLIPQNCWGIKGKNIVLLIFSLLFYAWGEPIYIFLMIFTTFSDYWWSKKISQTKAVKKTRRYLLFSLFIDLGLLAFFKYSDFLIQLINSTFSISLPLLNLPLPIGISFYTFQSMSYTIDVYRKSVPVEKNYFTYLTYVCMFPQLIAGPIVRYETVHQELSTRKISLENFTIGLFRFFQGLFKKVLLANNIGLLWTTISMNLESLSSLMAWLGLIAFALQIYFDFSAYSDMAIGMGRMLGFTFLENFNYPYISKSITEFWRRWHISLSSWFKDYVYIPLGGSRVNKARQIRNIMIVWFLTGFWHGAAWNFILWGLYFGILLLLEKYVLKKYIDHLPNMIKHLYTIFLLLIGWMIFAFDDITKVFTYGKILFCGLGNHFVDSTFFFYLKNYFFLFLITILFSMPIYPKFQSLIKRWQWENHFLYSLFVFLIYVILLLISISYLVSSSYNPFLYFRF